MTEPKTPPRRTARSQPTKARSAATPADAATPRKAAPLKTTTAAAKVSGPATKAPARKTGAKVATPAAKAPAPKSTAKPVAPKPSPVAAKVAPPSPPKPAPAAGMAKPAAETVKARQQPKGDSFKLRMLVDQVVKATGGKKKGVKDVVEATLSRIGEALARGDELNLPGFGKVRIVKTDAKDGSAVMTLKLRQGTAKPGQKALAGSLDDD